MPTVRICKSVDDYLTLLAKKTGHSKAWHAENAIDAYILKFEDAIESGEMDKLVLDMQAKRESW